MTIIEQIKAEIERHLNSATEHQNANPDMPKYRWYLYEGEKELCTDLLDYIDDSIESEKSMQEGLEEEIVKVCDDFVIPLYFPLYGLDDEYGRELINKIASHFAQWGADHAPLPEDTVLFNKGVAEGKRLMIEGAVEVCNVVEEGRYCQEIGPIFLDERAGFKPGDKVRVIVCKKED